MTKAKYLALADLQALWTDKIKPWINQQKADKSELPSSASVQTCESIIDELT